MKNTELSSVPFVSPQSLYSSVCEFPVAKITKYFRRGGVKQQNIVLSAFWRSSPKPQSKGVGRAVIPVTAGGESPSWPLPASDSPSGPWCL